MPDRVLPIEVHLQLFDLREALAAYKRLTTNRSVTSHEAKTALQRIREIRAALDPIVPQAPGIVDLTRVFEETALASAVASDDTTSADQIWERIVAPVRRNAPESGRAHVLRAACRALEGPKVEFIASFPRQAQGRDLGKEIAALAPGGGSIYLGIDDTGHVVGLALQSRAEIDAFDLRVRGVAEKGVDPSIPIRTNWLTVNDAVVLEVEIAPSGEPIHCVDNIPYVRDGSASRPAQQVEIVRAVRDHLERQGWAFRPGNDEPERPTFAKTSGGGLGQSGGRLTPDWKIRQVSGTPIATVQWRFRGLGSSTEWRTAHGDALERTHITAELVPQVISPHNGQGPRSELLLEIRYYWRDRWRREIHHWPLTRRESLDGDRWDLGEETLPPGRIDDDGSMLDTPSSAEGVS